MKYLKLYKDEGEFMSAIDYYYVHHGNYDTLVTQNQDGTFTFEGMTIPTWGDWYITVWNDDSQNYDVHKLTVSDTPTPFVFDEETVYFYQATCEDISLTGWFIHEDYLPEDEGTFLTGSTKEDIDYYATTIRISREEKPINTNNDFENQLVYYIGRYSESYDEAVDNHDGTYTGKETGIMFDLVNMWLLGKEYHDDAPSTYTCVKVHFGNEVEVIVWGAPMTVTELLNDSNEVIAYYRKDCSEWEGFEYCSEYFYKETQDGVTEDYNRWMLKTGVLPENKFAAIREVFPAVGYIENSGKVAFNEGKIAVIDQLSAKAIGYIQPNENNEFILTEALFMKLTGHAGVYTSGDYGPNHVLSAKYEDVESCEVIDDTNFHKQRNSDSYIVEPSQYGNPGGLYIYLNEVKDSYSSKPAFKIKLREGCKEIYVERYLERAT